MEVKIYQDSELIHKVYGPKFQNPKLDVKQRELVINTLKSKCTGCSWNNKGCSTMQSIDKDMQLLDKKGELIMTEWCDAAAIGVEV